VCLLQDRFVLAKLEDMTARYQSFQVRRSHTRVRCRPYFVSRQTR
jgi:hypothetical protein